MSINIFTAQLPHELINRLNLKDIYSTFFFTLKTFSDLEDGSKRNKKYVKKLQNDFN